ncbi:MAG: YggT family protein [Candidatus Acidulodesulfobacterium ferriphilum]|uniref:YggT family protein n=1 Tax=Candidatus Acidulodesulfobacterium ferriphilum TaxID=2597223 RepID=A0A519BCA5_9DELT|nr:YggT family protein [Deltaproteobacteria bacterium]MCL5893196.1 YggT family protein [Deltaproteobacteria bacterium]MDA8052732.1 YggT family protein [Deltaproteobacteria bacterium]RZD14913.1 MAG: YggT family protein [Candidatus Acidulodesulfobacterium ferriphilum]
MGLLYNFIQFIFSALNFILWAYMWIIIIKALLSWVNPDPYNPIVRFINDITEPVLEKVRIILPLGNVMAFDLSPIIVILIIYFIQYILRYVEYYYVLPLMFTNYLR